MPEAVHIPWQPIGGGRASEAIYDQLRELITSGVLKPGDRLPSERAMMEQLHRSRPTIREALRMLEQGGYVASTHGASGAVVQELTIDGVEQPLSAMLQLNQISLEELGEYRAVNDGTIAGWAARRRTDKDLAALDSCLTAAEQALGDYRRFAELDVRFHSLLPRHRQPGGHDRHRCPGPGGAAYPAEKDGDAERRRVSGPGTPYSDAPPGDTERYPPAG